MIIKNFNRFVESISPNDMWDIIPDSIKELYSMFNQSGKKLYIVGGSVRDFLNNDKAKDFDLATDATPDEVIEIVSKKFKYRVQGKAFFVVVVFTHDQPLGMEISTFREDVYGELLGKTRNPEVKYSTIDKDVERRDITYNALFYDLGERKIIDLIGGIEDLKNNITRFVGDPDMRIKEDPLRILRILRFTSRYGFVIEDKTTESIKKNKEQLNIITKNRIWEEFYNAHKQVKDFSVYLNYLTEFDLWGLVFPNITINKDIVKTKSIEVYFANLFRNEDIETLFDKMVYEFLIPKEIAIVTEFLIELNNFVAEDICSLYKKKNIYKISDDLVSEWYDVANLNKPTHRAFLIYKPVTTTKELMDLGFKGRELGVELQKREVENFKNLIIE
jgi:tRNA nucleotidyltransferase/poly(A) polymerase